LIKHLTRLEPKLVCESELSKKESNGNFSIEERIRENERVKDIFLGEVRNVEKLLG